MYMTVSSVPACNTCETDFFVSFFANFGFAPDDCYSMNFPILLIATDFTSENQEVLYTSNKVGFKPLALFLIFHFSANFF